MIEENFKELILVHGFKSVIKEDYEKIKELVENVAKYLNYYLKLALEDLKLTVPL